MTNDRIVKKAFTLIELLVVIAIIALLLSILVPALNKVKQRARGVQCMSNMKQQSLIFTLYAQDNHDKYPSRGTGYPHYLRSMLRPNSSGYTREALDSYVEDPYITICPGLASYKMDAGEILKDPYADTWYSLAGWETDDPVANVVCLGYLWFFNFDNGSNVTYYGERPWPTKQTEAASSNVLAAHQLGYIPGYVYSDWGHEASSKGRIFSTDPDFKPDDVTVFTSRIAPVAYGDGSVIPVPQSRFRKRADIGTYIYYY